MFYTKLTSLNGFPIEEGSLGQFKKSLDSFYVTDSHLSVTNTAEMAMFYIKMTSLNDYPVEEGLISPTG